LSIPCRRSIGQPTLDAAGLLTIPASEDKSRINLRIRLPDRTVTAEVAAKSLRRAQTPIRGAIGAPDAPDPSGLRTLFVPACDDNATLERAVCQANKIKSLASLDFHGAEFA
jgi:hypothetical protein